MTASQDLESLYRLLSELRTRLGGFRYLHSSTGKSGWPNRGVYYFFDDDEPRASGSGLRVVRVGTHALRVGNRPTLWGRLHNHKGNDGGRYPGGGNHRGSVFRYHVGAAMVTQSGDHLGLLQSWMNRSEPAAEHAAA